MYYTWKLPREILVYFTHGHSAKAQTSLRIKQSRSSLCPIVNAALCTGTCNCFRSELPSMRLGCKYERLRHTGWSTKESWDVSSVYSFIYLFFLFYSIFIFLLRCLWSAKMLRIEGQLSVYEAASFWTVYFSPGTSAGSDHD